MSNLFSEFDFDTHEGRQAALEKLEKELKDAADSDAREIVAVLRGLLVTPPDDSKASEEELKPLDTLGRRVGELSRELGDTIATVKSFAVRETLPQNIYRLGQVSAQIACASSMLKISMVDLARYCARASLEKSKPDPENTPTEAPPPMQAEAPLG